MEQCDDDCDPIERQRVTWCSASAPGAPKAFGPATIFDAARMMQLRPIRLHSKAHEGTCKALQGANGGTVGVGVQYPSNRWTEDRLRALEEARSKFRPPKNKAWGTRGKKITRLFEDD